MSTLSEEFAVRLRSERLRRGLTQEQLAEILNVSQRQISRYETARSMPNLERLTALGQAGFEIDYLLRGRVGLDIEIGCRIARLSLEDQLRMMDFLSGSLHGISGDEEREADFIIEILRKISEAEQMQQYDQSAQRYDFRVFTDLYEAVSLEEYYEMLELSEKIISKE